MIWVVCVVGGEGDILVTTTPFPFSTVVESFPSVVVEPAGCRVTVGVAVCELNPWCVPFVAEVQEKPLFSITS